MEPDLKKLKHPNEDKYSAMWKQGNLEQWDEPPVISQKDLDWYDWIKDWKNSPDEWEQDEATGEWRVKNAMYRQWHAEVEAAIQDRDGKIHWNRTRLPKHEYYERKRQMEEHGIGEVELTPQKTGKLYSLRVKFPEGFKHLTNEVGQSEKEKEESGYHISLMYEGNDIAQGVYDEFMRTYFGNTDKPIKHKFDKVKVTNGSTYQFDGDNAFEKALNNLVRMGTGKDYAHVSLD